MNPKPTAREEYLEARVEALVRALEEAKRDSERLKFVLERYAIEAPNNESYLPRWVETVEEIDAAMDLAK